MQANELRVILHFLSTNKNTVFLMPTLIQINKRWPQQSPHFAHPKNQSKTLAATVNIQNFAQDYITIDAMN